MKLITLILLISILYKPSYTRDSCVSVIISIERFNDTLFVVTEEDLLHGKPVGVFTEFWADEESIAGMIIGCKYNTFYVPKHGYWKFKDIYVIINGKRMNSK